MKPWILTPLIAAALLTSGAETPDVDTLIARANQAAYYAGKDGRSDVEMTITDASGGTRTRNFRILRRNNDDGPGQKFYVWFTGPADVRKTAYLVWKNGGGKDDDRWLYLPALNLVRRIAPGDKRTSFVGSDFVYEDVSGRDPSADKHELVGHADGRYQIRNIPKDPGSVEFKEYTVWLDDQTYLPVKAEYLDANGQLYRRVSADRVELIDGHPTVVQSTVEDLARGGKTVSIFSNVEYDIGLSDRIFTERFLKRPPREVQ